MATIRIKRNDGWTKQFSVKDCDGELVDCTGWKFYLTVRAKIPGTDLDDDTTLNGAIIAKEVDGESSGIHSWVLSKEDTNIDPDNYMFDIQADKGDGIPISTETGVFTIQADITRRV